MNNEDNVWTAPRYYAQFKCKADKCRHTCCRGWRIPISFLEYTRLLGIPCSAELRQKIDVAFCEPRDVSEERYRVVSHDWQGNCRLLENGLCLLYKENWQDCLPAVCDLYPRSLRQYGDRKTACCSSACERVVELLMEDGSSIMTEISLDRQPTIVMDEDEEKADKLRKYSAMLVDRTFTLAQRISDICLLINEKQFVSDSRSRRDPLTLALTILNRLTERQNFLYDIVTELTKRYGDDPKQYQPDRDSFEKRLAQWETVFLNIIANSLIYENFPYVDDRIDETQAYKGLCAVYGLMRVVCIGYLASRSSSEDLVDALSALFHLIEHTAFYYNAALIADKAAVLLKL